MSPEIMDIDGGRKFPVITCQVGIAVPQFIGIEIMMLHQMPSFVPFVLSAKRRINNANSIALYGLLVDSLLSIS